ncbi:MAG TPA: adenylate/guanylate cyclase domain-containing protein [Tepidisphaeraceae bacterium]|jgi:class 3 adenylate cyclase|nr:adenylate/guanylate cyclase domain-containing protein [Tepidisphaeraceae bacterium]
MRLGTKILLLTLAATVGLSGTVIWLVTRDVTARETDRARHTIKWAVSGYFASVDEWHQRDARLVHLLMEEPVARSQLSSLEEDDAEVRRFAQAQLAQELFGRGVQIELTHAGISPSFHVLLNSRGNLLFTNAIDNPALSKALASQTWPFESVLGSDPFARKYLWVNNALYLALAVPVRTTLGEEPNLAYFVGYRVDDQWLGKLLHVVREDASRREESLGVISAWFLVDGNIVARATSSGDSGAALPDRAAAIVTASAKSRAAEQREEIQFTSNGERFVGESVIFNPSQNVQGILAVVNSLDQQLVPLRRLQRNIAILAIVIIIIALIIARFLARLIAGPIEQVVAGTQRIASGIFDQPLTIKRRDEIGQLAVSFNSMAAGLKQRDLIKDTFGKFVSPRLVEDFLTDPRRLQLSRRVQTVLMSDLENFTPMTERLRPEDLVALLNDYLGRAADIVSAHGGIVDKFIADAVVAFWGPPFSDDHSTLACRAALALVRCTSEMADACQRLNIRPLRVRIGIATGEVLAGIIGSSAKQDYTVIGDIANLAARLEGVNKIYKTQILATSATAQAAKDSILFRKLDTVRVIGRSEPVEVFQVLADSASAPPQCLDLRQRYAEALQLYENRNWSAAASAFAALASAFPEDAPAAVMAARCNHFITTPPDLNWDGIWQQESK